MITHGALEFFEVGEVLGAACGFFGGEEVDLTRGNTDAELRAGLGEVRFIQAEQRQSELPECPHEPPGIFWSWLNPKIQIFGVARLGMVDDSVSADHQEPNQLLGEDA